jgi:hypothetical protein
MSGSDFYVFPEMKLGGLEYKCLVPLYVFPEMKLRGFDTSETEL